MVFLIYSLNGLLEKCFNFALLFCILVFLFFCREDILVFLTGQDEIETMTQQIRQICQHEESLSHSFRQQQLAQKFVKHILKNIRF